MKLPVCLCLMYQYPYEVKELINERQERPEAKEILMNGGTGNGPEAGVGGGF